VKSWVHANAAFGDAPCHNVGGFFEDVVIERGVETNHPIFISSLERQ
jgi:hypothetical protein